jgi:A/G-specific adenine glycosylase
MRAPLVVTPVVTPKVAAIRPPSEDRAAFRRALLRWYQLHHRQLPWRETTDPYRIWLSEIMLQQTRVAAVLDHYRIFLERFPDVRTLAAADEDHVLAAWSGLGYYRRARMLHRCAIALTQKHSGEFPRTSAALLLLPGIGRYTAAAIASIAFGEPVAVVDGNVERVLQRITGSDLQAAQTWKLAQEFLAKSKPADFNQAMMELGAMVCLPRAPRCNSCPVRRWCATQAERPRRAARARQKKKQIWCSLEERGAQPREQSDNCIDKIVQSEVRLMQRPKTDALMPGMWELPQSSVRPQNLTKTSIWRTFRHSITLTDYTVHVLRGPSRRAETLGIEPSNSRSQGQWITTDRIEHIPVTGLTRKILQAARII